ncbi:MAG TPA: polysaccharide biosynthesis/export family protein [Stellaceae bacterium]|nr:polysaccharide biosynthesis/export family protein [Stellaceae bacterium]
MIFGRTPLFSVTRGRRAYVRRHWASVIAVAGALTAASTSLADPPQRSEIYALAPGDRIALTVVGQPELSGEVTIDGSGSIMLPFVGPIHIEDLSILACEQLIRDRLADGFLKEPVVSVRISEPRPLYILGDVRTPGAYPFRYGSTVQSAVALAGGFGIGGPLQSGAMSEFLSADERVRQLTFEQTALRIREARLEAQRDGKETFAPPDLPPSVSDKEGAGLAASEQATLAAQAAILKTQVELLNGQKPRLQKEIDATNAQMVTVRNRLEFVKNETSRSAQLVKQGIGVHASEVQLKLQEANEESNLWSLAAQLSRLQMNIGELDIKIEEAEAAFNKQTLAELQNAHQRLAELNVTLPSAREIRDFKLQQAENAAGIEAPRSINITRTRHGQVLVLPASETTPLEPGDVIEIRVDLRKALPGQSMALRSPGS